jgi:uncharacterized membrane protein
LRERDASNEKQETVTADNDSVGALTSMAAQIDVDWVWSTALRALIAAGVALVTVVLVPMIVIIVVVAVPWASWRAPMVAVIMTG